MPLFEVIASGRSTAFNAKYGLKKDNWNDYGFRTTYMLFKKIDENSYESLGVVNILKQGQLADMQHTLPDAFDKLPKEFVSVGASVDYYFALNKLEVSERNKLLALLRDINRYPKSIEKFSSEEGWKTSLFRDRSKLDEVSSYLTKTKAVLDNEYSEIADEGLAFDFTPTGWKTGLEIDFSGNSSDFTRTFRGRRARGSLPSRISVLIGRNGSGKSTLLSRLARVAFASPQERVRKIIKPLGDMTPNGLGFMKIITISYSAFDSFALPVVYAGDIKRLAQPPSGSEGKFVFCGLRDVRAEATQLLEVLGQPDQSKEVEQPERYDIARLRTLEELAGEFEDMILGIKENGKLENLFEVLQPIFRDNSFRHSNLTDLKSFMTEEPSEYFLSLSTGHKICLHSIVSLVRHLVPQSLVLFDEPETHLHPPLTAALMHSLSLALYKANAFAVVATHSPVVVQETLAEHVNVISRIGDQFTIKQPDLETFGENVGLLTNDLMNLRADEANFYFVLDELVDYYEDYDEIDALFEPGLSSEARVYVRTRLLEISREKES